MPADAPSLAEVQSLLDAWYPPGTADSWDRVGRVWGADEHPVRRVLLAVDPAPVVAAEAEEWGADLLVVHHPLFLKGVHGFTPATPKGRTLTTLVRAGCALVTAHTNADLAEGGVSEAMALALGLEDVAPLVPDAARPAGPALDKLGVYVPVGDAEALRAVLAAAGAGRIGDYDQASFTTRGEGRFRPLDGANPTIGTVGVPEVVDEVRIEVVLPRAARAEVVAAMIAAHPYEEPAYDVTELADPAAGAPVRTGTGRVGTLPQPLTLAEFARHVGAALPSTAGGVRAGGDPDRLVRRVALCGGAGDFLLDTVRARGAADAVDVYVTSDLRHHPASEFLEHGDVALVDVPHWAAEWTWLPRLEQRLAAALPQLPGGDTVELRVSTTCTDPWSLRG
ncbi:Nif3-like dinuclear metal center hexameric protein [Nocardioides sp. GY 10127]|uniref:Nif3-like dinuclear metal center hexameric protein n=1 Tax=Nocardioides sp. GY 10127 TaxID=2569762 RepID=UPI0010A850AB|nr:Nif3-like dinuclear metal center hexameric protein [Nocardioides sp. GY 10127]TIC85706.1 Nif3-like dinuclear metal center hexameric protein [Nocardioides sp. GY 10127]